MTEDQLEHPLTGYTGKTGRPRNRRRVTVEHLRQIKKWAGMITTRWEVGARVYVPPKEREPGSLDYLRPRVAHEYPENDPEEWQRLADYMAVITSRAVNIRLWAMEQKRLTAERLEAGDA